MSTRSKSALLLVGHGSTTNPDSSTPTRLLAKALAARGIFQEVQCCFWKEEPFLGKALETLRSDKVFIVPNFISEAYFTRTVLPRELALEGPVTRRDNKTLYYCKPVGSHPSMTGVLLKRAAETAPGIPPDECSLLLVGHGTNRDPNSSQAVKTQAERIAALGLFAEVQPCTMEPMEDVPLVSEWNAITSKKTVVVIPFFISDGLHSYQDIPVLLGLRTEIGPAASQSDVFKSNPHEILGRQLYYGSAVGTDPGMADVVLDQVNSFEIEQRLI